jgi:hypothetical protein
MSRVFVGGAQVLRVNVAVVTNAPLSVFCWVRPSATSFQILWWSGDSASNNVNQRKMSLRGSAAGLRYEVEDALGTPGAEADVDLVYSTGVWYPCGAVEAADDSRQSFFGGLASVVDTTPSLNVTGANRTSLGRLDDSGPSNTLEGAIGHCAVWDAALTEGEMLSMHAGLSPLRVRRDALVAYWPLQGRSPEIDLVQGNNLTLIGGQTLGSEPPLIHKPVMVAPP